MPNHYTNVIVARPPASKSGTPKPAELNRWATGLLARLMPVPPTLRHPNPEFMTDEEHRWCVATWGTKWDVYDVSTPSRLPGDCIVYLINFCTAWGPPCYAARALAVADAEKRGITIMSWVGLDPLDCSASNLYTRERTKE